MEKSEKIALVCENTNECYSLIFQLWNDGKTVVFLDGSLPTKTIVELLDKVFCDEVIVPDKELTLKSELDAAGLNTVFFNEIRNPAFKIQIDNINSESKMIVFSSGTTSSAKAIVLPVEALVRATKKLAGYLAVGIEGPAYIQAPLSHLWSLCSSMALLFQNRKFMFGSLIKEKKQIAELNPAIYVSVPSIIEKRFSNHTGIKHYISAGTFCSETLEAKVRNAGKTIQNCYGTTEVAGIVAISACDRPVNRLIPFENCRFDFVNDGTWICTDTLMEGYFGQESLTKEVLDKDRFFTADIIRDNQDGTYSVLGRSDTVVALNNGIKIELESMDAELKKIISGCDVCVLYIDEKLVLAIEYADLDIQKSINIFNEGQPYYSRISEYVIIGAPFPRTNSGKLKRNELKSIVERKR